MKYCPMCGVEVQDSEIDCPRCGTRIDAPALPASATLSFSYGDAQEEPEALFASALEPAVNVEPAPESEFAPVPQDSLAFAAQAGHQDEAGVPEIAFEPDASAIAPGVFQAGGQTAVFGANIDRDEEPQASLFQAQGDMVVVRPTVNVTQPAQDSFCSFCRGYHPQSEMFHCTECSKDIGAAHQAGTLGVCRTCAERAYEVAVACAAVAEGGNPRLLIASNLLASQWSVEAELDSVGLPLDWRETLAQSESADTFSRAKLIEELGRPLFSALLPPIAWLPLRNEFARRAELRYAQIKLVDLPANLAALPWESLCPEDRFLCLSRHTQVVRWTNRNGVATLGQVQGPLRVVTIAGQGQGGTGSSAQEEAAQLAAGMVGADDGSHAEFEPVRFDTSGALSEQLAKALQTHPHILHFTGDFEVEFDAGGPLIVLRSNSKTEKLRLDVLSHWLEDSGVQVVLFGGRLWCEAVGVAPTDPRLQWADALLRGSVAALVAFQFELSPDQVRDFAQAFYGQLAARGKPAFPRPGLSEAMVAGRKALLSPERGDASLAWIAPVLFTRAVEGAFLDLVEPPPEAVSKPRSWEPFVEEPMRRIALEEAPLCADVALQQALKQHAQLIVGPHDAAGMDIARQVARRLIDSDICSIALRFPGYASSSSLLPSLRALAQSKERAVVLCETEGWERSIEELDDLAAVVGAPGSNIFALVSVSMRDEPTEPFSLWLQRNPLLWTQASAKDYPPEILSRILERELSEAKPTTRLSPTTAKTLLEYAQKGKLFGAKQGQISLPGQLVRLIYGLLPNQPALKTERQLQDALKTLSDAPEDLRHWFSDSLDDSQRAFVLTIALLQGLPTHLFAPIYRQVVARLRKAYQLNLTVLPVGAELRRWSLYIQEIQRRVDGGQQTDFVEFASEFVEREVLALLQEAYREWLLEVVPLLGDLACGNLRLEVQGPAWGEADLRAVRAAVTRGLGEIGKANARALTVVGMDAERWLTGDWPNVPAEAERQVRAIPGYVLRYIADSQKPGLEDGLVATLARWHNHTHYKVRWVAASACGRLAGVLPLKRVLPTYLALANQAREESQKAFQEAYQLTKDARAAASSPAYVTALQIYQSATYALRLFRPADFDAIRRVFDQAAGEENVGVRINTAVALDRVAAEKPDAAISAVLSWADPAQWPVPRKWAYWWTAAASAALLVEHQRAPGQTLMDMWARLLMQAKGLPGRGPDQVAYTITRAMEASQGRESDDTGALPLARVMGLLGTLIGSDPWVDRVVGLVFDRASTDTRAASLSAAAVFKVLQAWLDPDCYELAPARRQIAVEAYVHAGAARRQEAVRLFRELAQFEAFDYGQLDEKTAIANGRSLAWLGVGGLLLQTAAVDGQEAVANLLPLLQDLGRIKDPAVRSVAPFVAGGLAQQHEPQVMEALKLWTRQPQWPLQLCVAELVMRMYQHETGSSDDLDQILRVLAAAPSSEVRTYLEARLHDLAAINLPAAARLREALGKVNVAR